MSDTNAWRFECCQRLLTALADESEPRLNVTVTKRKKSRHHQRFFTATVYDKTGRLLAACRHELDPFPVGDGPESRLMGSIHYALTI